MVNEINKDSVLTDFKRKKRNRHNSLINDYNELMEIDGAVQKKVFEILAKKHKYKSGNCVKMTLYKLKVNSPERFINVNNVENQ